MSLTVSIFEDDKELAEFLKELMEQKDYSVTLEDKLQSDGWTQADVVLGDFRNKIVSFSKLRTECAEMGITLIAISGMETGFTPQLLKPFLMEDIERIILAELVKHPRDKRSPRKIKKGLFASLFGKVS